MPNPWLIIGAIVLGVTVYFAGHHAGFVKRDQEMQAEIARLNAQAREKEQQLNAQLANTSTQLKDANDAVSKKQTDLNRLINSGRVRLNATGCSQGSASASSAGGDRNQEASESERETLRAIAELAAEADRRTNQLNACIDAYNQVREQVNGQP